MIETICAVVVTYNRKDSLRECVRALLAQTVQLSTILVVNNFSTDGTLEMLRSEFPAEKHSQIEVLALPCNVGGAGGFHAGMEHAFASGSDWIWLMDDDVVPHPNALKGLLSARASFPPDRAPILLASKIVTPDGAIDAATVPWVKRRDMESMCFAAEHQTLSLRVNSFVAVLIHRSMIEKHGLPVKDYFIWLDDVEYTARILRTDFGVLVPQSLVTHHRAAGAGDPGPRFYYSVRNKLWIIRHSVAFSGGEKLRLAGTLAPSIYKFITSQRISVTRMGVLLRGLRDGLFSAPTASP